MRVEIRDHETGWFSIEISLKDKDLQNLIHSLTELRKSEVGQHFHISNTKIEGDKGVFDIEFIKDEKTGMDSFQGPSSLAKGSS